jgi:glucokinase
MIQPDNPLVLAADIGGTKVRLGLYRRDRGRPAEVVPPERCASRSAPDLETHIERFLAKHEAAASVHSACLGIAGPVFGGHVETTNLPWTVSEASLRKQFAWPRVDLINDLVATALSIPVLTTKALVGLNRTEPDAQGHLAVVAAGTGLGKALVAAGRHETVPVASEGGHADFAPGNLDQWRLWHHLHNRFGHVSQERVLSGEGLINIYTWLRDDEALRAAPMVEDALESGRTDAARRITENGLARQSAICRQALITFVTIFGALAGNWALETLPRGGVYLAGGIVPEILPALQTEGFMMAFCAKGRFAKVMTRFPVRVVMDDRSALLGAARWALMAT